MTANPRARYAPRARAAEAGRPPRVGEAPTPRAEPAPRTNAPRADRAAAWTATAAATASPKARLVDVGPLAPGQMRKSAFVEELRAAVTDAASEELAAYGGAAQCPYIERYFGHYGARPAHEGEALLRRFAPDASAARSAAEMIPAIVERVRIGTRRWRADGSLPAEVAALEPGHDVPEVGPPGVPLTIAALEAHLGAGAAPDPEATARIEANTGLSAGDARVHTSAAAHRITSLLGARAVTAGRHILFSEGAYAPGQLDGDTLLAHELVHVQQQSAASRAPGATLEALAAERSAAESDAARALEGAADGRDARPGRFGLGLQRCERDQEGSSSQSAAEDPKKKKIEQLEADKETLESVVEAGSGQSFGEVGSAIAKLRDIEHDLSVLKTGTGKYTGKKSDEYKAGNTPTGVTGTDCTEIVLEVLEATFDQQGRSDDWAKVEKKMRANEKIRGGGGVSGIDLQAALQSECGWKGIFWAPDPSYQVPEDELSGAKSDEANYAHGIAKKNGTYLKGFAGKDDYPGVSIDHTVVDYAPEAPNAGHGDASTTTKDTTELDKLAKIPFGVLSAHGGQHMTIITYGKVIEVHWKSESDSVDVITRDDLGSWAVGPTSGYHYFASGAIVAPAEDVDAAFE